MCSEDLRRVLRVGIDKIEADDWGWLLRPPELGGCEIAGPRDLVHCALSLLLVARAEQRLVQGRLQEAWELFDEAAALLPPGLFRRDPATGAAVALLPPKPPEHASFEVTLAWRIGRQTRRGQVELLELRERFVPGRMKPRDELIEAMIRFLAVLFDPRTFAPDVAGASVWDDGVVVEATRETLISRATALRQFANPTHGCAVSQSVWRDVGGLRGLHGQALARLAARDAPVPWWGQKGTAGLRPQLGAVRAWQQARRWRADQLPREGQA